MALPTEKIDVVEEIKSITFAPLHRYEPDDDDLDALYAARAQAVGEGGGTNTVWLPPDDGDFHVYYHNGIP